MGSVVRHSNKRYGKSSAAPATVASEALEARNQPKVVSVLMRRRALSRAVCESFSRLY
jgi:hypothetical protein